MADYEGILGSTPEWLSRAEESMKQSDAKSALEVAQKACDDYRSKGDKKGEGVALVMLSNAAYSVGDYGKFQKCSSEALGAFQTTKDAIGESAALVLVANAAMQQGDFQEALSTGEDAADLAGKAGSMKQLAYCKKAVAAAALALLENKENLDPEISAKALEASNEAATAFRNLGATDEMAAALQDLALAYFLSGNTNMAIAKAKLAQRMCQAESNVGGEARALVTLAQAMHKEGGATSQANAMDHLTQAAELFVSIGDMHGQAMAYGLMEQFQALSLQDRRDFTKRVMSRFDKQDLTPMERTIAGHRLTPGAGPTTQMFLPPTTQVKSGPCVTSFYGFMGRAATVVAPRGSGSGPVQNRFLLYNVSWN